MDVAVPCVVVIDLFVVWVVGVIDGCLVVVTLAMVPEVVVF